MSSAMPKHIKDKFLELMNESCEAGHSVDFHFIPPTRYIVAPIVTERELREKAWLRDNGKPGRASTMAGLKLISWMRDNGIDYAPISDNNFSLLLQKIGA